MLIYKFGTPWNKNQLSFSKEKQDSLIKTYPGKPPPRQRFICALINIQPISSPAPLIRRNIGLTVVERTLRRAAVDDLHDDTVTYPANSGAVVTACVGDTVAETAVGGWTARTDIVGARRLAGALIRVDAGETGAAGYGLGGCTSSGAIGSTDTLSARG